MLPPLSSQPGIIGAHHVQQLCKYWGSNAGPHAGAESALPSTPGLYTLTCLTSPTTSFHDFPSIIWEITLQFVSLILFFFFFLYYMVPHLLFLLGF